MDIPKQMRCMSRMKRIVASFTLLLAGGLGVAGCATSRGATHPATGRLTIQVRLNASRVAVGTPISGYAVVENGTSKAISWNICAQDLAVGLVGHGATFDPLNDDVARECFSPRGLGSGRMLRYPITVETTYDACGLGGVPICPRDGFPLLPLGSYSVDLVASGLPSSISRVPTPKVTLINAASGRSSGPVGGSVLIQAYGCETMTYAQPPISVVLLHHGQVMARRSSLGVTQEFIVSASPGSYVVRSSTRAPIQVRVVNGVQEFVDVMPRCH